MQKTLGYYLSDPQIQINPQDHPDLMVSNVTLESETETSGEDRCKWV